MNNEVLALPHRVEHVLISHVTVATSDEENWSFPGLSEANLRILEPRAFPLKLAKSAQGFPNLDNNSQGHPTCFKSPWEFTLHLLSSLSIQVSTQ
jgi:hypothetical protein